MNPIPPEIMSKAIARYRSGMTTRQAAAGLMGESTLRKHMALRGVKGHRNGRAGLPTLTVAMINAAIARYLAGASLVEASEGVCCKYTLRKHMRARGIPLRRGGRFGVQDPERTMRIYQAWRRRKTLREVAERFGINKSTVHHHVKQAEKLIGERR